MKQFANHAAGGEYTPTKKTRLENAEAMAFRIDDQLILWVISDNDDTVYSNTTIYINDEAFDSSTLNRSACIAAVPLRAIAPQILGITHPAY